METRPVQPTEQRETCCQRDPIAWSRQAETAEPRAHAEEVLLPVRVRAWIQGRSSESRLSEAWRVSSFCVTTCLSLPETLHSLSGYVGTCLWTCIQKYLSSATSGFICHYSYIYTDSCRTEPPLAQTCPGLIPMLLQPAKTKLQKSSPVPLKPGSLLD